MDNKLFRQAMSKFATGINIVTIRHNNVIHGMTVNAFMSVSLDPKLIAISIDEKASMYQLIQDTKEFGISILLEDQKDISMILAKQKAADKEIEYKDVNNIPVLKDALVTMSCKVDEMVPAGDHMIFIAEVTSIEVKEGNPILYYNGKYRKVDKE
ncbi:flavin reductase family protein [Aquibacillus koreensis]|uniref:Flavin reductase family protein n=1 Tax=Aquibacillus koreensis TaxID=279446 RepID=A0A9X3WM17_9BACI|nr:flavin reductase family protein [Aquibacillus koreensis]MCT2536374.1 flavin reductase family protein [Aquibacillus koreensis]MDC3421275.1 flavin reductase family protein [Aquibacillus koreensis]